MPSFLNKLEPFARRHFEFSVTAIGVGLLFLAYTFVFWLTREEGLPGAVFRTLVSLVPGTVLAIASYKILKNYVLPRAYPIHIAAHLCLGLVYAFGWYLAITVTYGLKDGWLTEGVTTESFSVIALVWQLLQGLILYALVGIFTYLADYRRKNMALKNQIADLKTASKTTTANTATPSRIMVKQDKVVIPLDVSDIVRINGEGDYVRIHTSVRTYTASSTLSKLEDTLASAQFVRIHRSHLINLDAVISAEPAGNGRMTIHMQDGESLRTSRTGSKTFLAATL